MDSDSDPQEKLFRTYSYMDAYLASFPVSRVALQLLGIACTLIATSDADAMEPSEGLARWLAFATDGACSPEEVQAKADQVRMSMGSRLNRPTVYTFLRRYLRQTGWTEESFSLANYLLELAVTDASFLEFKPQAMAAAATVLSRQYLSQGVSVCHMPRWKSRLLKHAQVDLKLELAPCIAAMSRLHAAQRSRSRTDGRFVSKKYGWSRLHSVAKLRPNTPCEATFFAAYLAVDGA